VTNELHDLCAVRYIFDCCFDSDMHQIPCHPLGELTVQHSQTLSVFRGLLLKGGEGRGRESKSGDRREGASSSSALGRQKKSRRLRLIYGKLRVLEMLNTTSVVEYYSGT